MSLNIWFVPCNTNHIGKNVALLRRMREVGHDVRIICLDNIQEPIHSNLEQIKKLDFEYETIPAGNFRLNCPPVLNAIRITRSLYHARQARKLPSLIRAFLLAHRRRPDVLIFGSDVDPAPRTFIQTARSLGIPGVLIVDGIYLPKNPDYHGNVLKRCCSDIVRRISHFLRCFGVEGTSGVELLFVINGTSKANLIGNGLPAEKIHIVGAPEYVVLAKRVHEMKAEDYRALRERLGIISDQPVVVFAHQPLLGREKLERMILEMIKGCRSAGAMLLVKFHPRSDDYPDLWRRWAEKNGFNQNQVVFMRDECTSQDTVIICSALITIYSTVLMEALTCHRPMIFIKFINTEYTLPFGEQYGIAVEVRREEDLAQSVASIVSDENLRKRLLDNFPRAIQEELNGLNDNVVEVMLEKIERFVESRRTRSPELSNN